MLDDAISYVAQDSPPAAERLLIQALEAASTLDVHSERGRLVPELDQPNVRQFLDELRARTWDDYFDFQPFARQYLREALGLNRDSDAADHQG